LYSIITNSIITIDFHEGTIGGVCEVFYFLDRLFPACQSDVFGLEL